jgi:Tol biopolymer transport system component
VKRVFLVVLILAGTGASPHAATVTTDLWAVRTDGLHLHRLTHDAERDFQPAVSPNGKLIAWAHGTPSQIWLMRRDGTHRRQLTAMPEDAFSPQWSPDGRRIAFMAYNSTECQPGWKWCSFTEVWVVDVTGANRRLFGRGVQPRWSANGERLVFYDWGPDSSTHKLRVAVLATGTSRTLASTPYDFAIGSPAVWSPRGGWIAFGWWNSSYKLDLIRRTGSARQRIGKGIYPAWSPDGRRLAVVRAAAMTQPGALWLLDPFGKARQRLVAPSLDEGVDPRTMTPTWSPGGDWIAYQEADELSIVRVTTRHTRALAFDLPALDIDVGPSPPAWTRDGRTLVFSRHD